MIKRILKLARDNERVVIVDPETERAFIVLPLDAYERLVDERAFDEEEFDAIDDDWVAPVDESFLDTDGLPDSSGAYARSARQGPFGASGITPAAAQQGHLTEQSLIGSIDRDIAAWKASQEQMSESSLEPTEAPMASPATSLDELTLTPVPGEEAPMKPPASAEEEKFYIEPVA